MIFIELGFVDISFISRESLLSSSYQIYKRSIIVDPAGS